MKTFVFVWIGQVVSTFGAASTSFALSVWVYQQTGSATRAALVPFALVLPGLLASPLIGALIDRWDRRRAMILSDIGAVASILSLVSFFRDGTLQIWHIYLLLAISAAFRAIQIPAFSASVTLLVPKEQLGRASGLEQTGRAVAQTLAPLLAGFLMVTIRIEGVLLINVFTFLSSLVILLFVRLPRPVPSASPANEPDPPQHGATYGWTYLKQRRGLLSLLILFACTNLAVGMVPVTITPLVLGFGSPEILGRVLATASIGLISGGLLMATWGGPQRRMVGVFALLSLQGLALLLGGWRPNAVLVAIAAFLFMFGSTVINGCSAVLWQSKVAPEVQGRVFAIRRAVALSSMPVAYVIGGLLVDFLEPGLQEDGALAATLGAVVGTGPGRGAALTFVALGIFVLLMVGLGWSYSPLRDVQEDLPDTIPTPPEPIQGCDPYPAPTRGRRRREGGSTELTGD